MNVIIMFADSGRPLKWPLPSGVTLTPLKGWFEAICDITGQRSHFKFLLTLDARDESCLYHLLD